MFPSQFAIAIVSPEAGVSHIVNAAIRNNVHIIDKEYYDSNKDYDAYRDSFCDLPNGTNIVLLFVFSDGSSSLVIDSVHVEDAVHRLRETAG